MRKAFLPILVLACAFAFSACDLVPSQNTANNTSALGINLSPVNFYQTNFPFVNLANGAVWRGTDWSTKGLTQLTMNGYIPVGQDGILLVIHDTTVYPWDDAGCNLILTYTGIASFTPSNGLGVVSSEQGRIVYSVPAGFRGSIYFTVTKHQFQLGNLRLVMEADQNNTELYRQAFLDEWGKFKTLRFMDLMATNGSNLIGPSDYPAENYLIDSLHMRLSSMAILCNKLNANAWICIPHQASDDLVRRIASYFSLNLNSNLKLYIEYSNECWNGGFKQYHWLLAQGGWMGLATDKYEAWMRAYAKRTAAIHDIFDAYFLFSRERLVRVVAWQAANAYQGNQVLDFYKEYAGHEPDALAVAPYFGHSLGEDVANSTVDAAEAVNWTLDQVFLHLGLTTPSQFSDGSDRGSLRQAQSWIRANATTARNHGIRLIAYEAGMHMVGVNAWQSNTTLTNLFIAANRDARMKDIYKQYLDIWRAEGGNEMMLFNSSGTFTKYGSWAIHETWRDTLAQSPKYAAALEWIDANPIWF